jgi:ParB family chromosome partitioning protein
MRIPWPKSKAEQLELVEEGSSPPSKGLTADAVDRSVEPETCVAPTSLSLDALITEGVPLLLRVESLAEDPGNPRTEFPDEEIAELAEDIALRGILQPIVVRRCGEDGRYPVLFGAKRLRAAKRAGLEVVPVVIGLQAHDAYAQVAENQKRHGLTPLDLARFIRARVDAGESNADIARQMGMDLTSVAHHLALLTLPPDLDEAFRSGRCTSPRTLYELAKLQKTKPEQVRALVDGEGGITRSAVASVKRRARPPRAASSKAAVPRRSTSLVVQANDLCARLELLLCRMTKPGASVTPDELAGLRRRMAQLGGE